MLTAVKLYKILVLVKIKEKYYLPTERGTYYLIFTFSCNVFQLQLIIFFCFCITPAVAPAYLIEICQKI